MNSNEAKHLPTEESTIEKRDMISSLHENILGHILSFVPIKNAVRTSVLSRRWIKVWTSITNLQFDDSLFFSDKKKVQNEQFVNFVEKVLLHFTNSSIKSFSLCLRSYTYDSSPISEWISFILERRVQKLHIQYFDKVLLSSKSLFSCNSLVELTLQMRCTISLPISVCLRNLQKLSVFRIEFVSDSSTYSKDITLSFPVLKVFEANRCVWSTMQNISLQVPVFERFSIVHESCKSAIKVYSRRLTDFSYKGNLEQDLVLYDSSLIRNASVVIVINEDKKDRMENFLRQLDEVERLELILCRLLRHAKDIFTNLPVFRRLTYLQLNEVNGEALLQLLHNCPILNTLVLLKGVADLNKEVFTFAMVPPCFLSSIKVFEFKEFNATEDDLCLVKFVLENASILEKMTISPAFWLQCAGIDIEKVKEQILSIPMCSSFCMTEFSDFSNGI